MNEKTKNILSWVLSILIVGSIITSFVIDPFNSLIGFLCILLAILSLCLLSAIVAWVKDLLYEFFSSSYFQRGYRKYISKHYESRRQLFRERGSEICARCDKDCAVKYPLRAYGRYDVSCTKRADVFIEENGLKVDKNIVDD